MSRRLPRPARLAIASARVALVASMVVVGLSARPDEPGPGYSGYPVNESPSHETRLLDRHDCSVTGFAEATPLSAIVRTAGGHLRHVSFDAGWEVYAAHGRARLVAVCLDQAPAQD
jgi:hypothetical protein